MPPRALHSARRHAALLVALLAPAAPAGAEPAADADPLESAVGGTVTVRLHTGKEYADATLVRVERDSRTGEPRRLRLKLPGGKMRTVGVAAIGAVVRDGRPVLENAPPADADSSEPRRPTRAERRAAAEAEEEARRADEHRKWLGRVKARGVHAWPEPSDDDHRAAVERAMEMIKTVQGLAPSMRLYETEHFLFVSNMPPPQVAPYVRYLDKMHAWMCKTYNLEPDARVFLGKATVFAFLEKEQFYAFERRFFETNPIGVYGLCHQRGNGDVVIACYRGQDPDNFGQMLVHETSHGFVHRYKTAARLPSWMNEGMAEHIGATMVPGSDAVRNKERRALTEIKQRRSLGGNFFADGQKIEFWQYGIASSMTRFLLSVDQAAYVRMVELIKEGVPPNEALEQAYKVGPPELAARYGQWVGVPGLRP